jgi:hypothetical protein
VSVGDGCPLLGKALLQVDQSTAAVQLAVPSFHVQAELAAYAAGAPAQTNTKIVIHAGSEPARARAKGRPAAGTGLTFRIGLFETRCIARPTYTRMTG